MTAREWYRIHEGWIATLLLCGCIFVLGALFGDIAASVRDSLHIAALEHAHGETIKAKDDLIGKLGGATAAASAAAAQATDQATQAVDEAKTAAAKSAQAAQTAQAAAVHAKAATADAKALKSTVAGAMRAATQERKP